jgi:hypothetical protein
VVSVCKDVFYSLFGTYFCNNSVYIYIVFHVCQMSTSGTIIQGDAKLAKTYVSIYMDKAPLRTS